MATQKRKEKAQETSDAAPETTGKSVQQLSRHRKTPATSERSKDAAGGRSRGGGRRGGRKGGRAT